MAPLLSITNPTEQPVYMTTETVASKGAVVKLNSVPRIPNEAPALAPY